MAIDILEFKKIAEISAPPLSKRMDQLFKKFYQNIYNIPKTHLNILNELYLKTKAISFN